MFLIEIKTHRITTKLQFTDKSYLMFKFYSKGKSLICLIFSGLKNQFISLKNGQNMTICGNVREYTEISYVNKICLLTAIYKEKLMNKTKI